MLYLGMVSVFQQVQASDFCVNYSSQKLGVIIDALILSRKESHFMQVKLQQIIECCSFVVDKLFRQRCNN